MRLRRKDKMKLKQKSSKSNNCRKFTKVTERNCSMIFQPFLEACWKIITKVKFKRKISKKKLNNMLSKMKFKRLSSITKLKKMISKMKFKRMSFITKLKKMLSKTKFKRISTKTKLNSMLSKMKFKRKAIKTKLNSKMMSSKTKLNNTTTNQMTIKKTLKRMLSIFHNIARFCLQ